jgi:hypothetical protein
MLIAYWHMFTTGQTYHDLGGDYFQRRDPARATNASSPDSKPSATTSPSNQPPPDPSGIPISFARFGPRIGPAARDRRLAICPRH